MRIFYRVMDIKYAMNRFDFFNPSSICDNSIIKKPTKIDTSSPIQGIKTSPTSPTLSSTTVTVKSEPNIENDIKCEKSISDNIQVKIENIDDNCDNSNGNLVITTSKNVQIKSENCDEITTTMPSPTSPAIKKNVNCKSEKSNENICENKILSNCTNTTTPVKLNTNENKKCAEKVNKTCDVKEKQVENLNKKVKSNENKLKLSENKQQQIISPPLSSNLNTSKTTTTTSTTTTQPPKIVIDDENEREKSIFLNTFQLTSTKSLSPEQLNKKSSSPPSLNIQSILSTSPPTTANTAKHKTSPKKVSPKSSTNMSTKTATKHKQQPLLPVPNGLKPSTSTPSSSTEVRTKRKYTFKTRPMGKKARLELERQQQLIAQTSNSANVNGNIKSSSTANKNIVNKVVNGFKSVLTPSSTAPTPITTPSPRVGEKRKIVSFNIPVTNSNSNGNHHHVVPEKRANYNNNNNSTSKISEANSLKSLFDNCNLNIPSSLSITLTEGPNDREMSQMMVTSPNELNTSPMMNSGSRSPASSTSSNASSNGTNNSPNFGGKRQSPPVNMYIEIFKIPDKVEQPQSTSPSQEQKQSKIPTPISKKLPHINGEKLPSPVSTATTTCSSKTIPTSATSTTAPSNSSTTSASSTATSKQQNIHKVTSLSTTNFVVHTTGIQSLGRKDAATALSKTPSLLPTTPNSGQQLGRKILPKLTTNTSTNSSFIPKLAESSKSATGFQKMFEEAIKRKEQAKAAQTLTKTGGVSSSTTSSSGNQQTINRKKETNKNSSSTTPPNNVSEEKSQSNTVLDLSSPNNRSKPNVVSRTSPTISTGGGSSQLSTPLSVQTNSHPPPRLTVPKNSKKIATNPQSNLISSTESSGSSNSPKGRCGTPLPALSVSVVPGNNNTNSVPPPTTALSPTTIQQQFNLTNLAQLRQVMLLRQQFELRNHLLQQKHQSNNNSSSPSSSGGGGSPASSSTPSGETLMQFENYMKSLQQQAALAAAAAAAQQNVTQNKK